LVFSFGVSGSFFVFNASKKFKKDLMNIFALKMILSLLFLSVGGVQVQASTQLKKPDSLVEREQQLQKKVLEEKKDYSEEVSTEPDANRYPERAPYFVKPQGPAKGGRVYTEHPDTKKGLLGISKQNAYQYETFKLKKTQSAWFRFAVMTPPEISGSTGTFDFKSMYSSNNLPLLLAGYEWQAVRNLGRLGLQTEIGLSNLDGKGRFKVPNNGKTKARESYQLYIVPLTVMLSYKFEYFDRQAIVPFVAGAFTYYGMAEKREDKDFVFAGSPAAGGGAGFNIS
jgi:hypothetical protein